jgi:ankyrin repeat protein
VDPKRLDNKNQTALHYVTSEPVARLLLADERIDPNATNDMGNTILHQAVEQECKEVVEVLLRDGRVYRHVRNGVGETALFMARRLGTSDNDIAFLFRNIGPPKMDILEESQRLSALGEESSDEEGLLYLNQGGATYSF